MSPIKVLASMLGLVLIGACFPCSALAGVTKPAPNQKFAYGTKFVEIGWDKVSGATTYKLKVLFNGTDFYLKGGVTGTVTTLTAAYQPGYYTVFVRGVNGSVNGPWSDPVTFIVQRNMTPANSVHLKSPSVFSWTRTPAATRYQLSLAKLNKKTGKYVVSQSPSISQNASGAVKWRPAVNSLTPGSYRWSITDYAGDKPGYTSTVYFRIETVLGSDYMVVDISGGPTAGSYPVTYLSDVPAGGWTDVYKTSKLVLRKVLAGTFTMGSPSDEWGRKTDEVPHQVTLGKAFYIGVFEVTQRQWELVTGVHAGFYTNPLYYATRPVEQVSYYEIRENKNNVDDPAANWPANSAVNAESFMGKLRAKTGLATFDLPTEAQWEYACRAGTTTALNSGKNLAVSAFLPDANMNKLGRYYFNAGDETVYFDDRNIHTGMATAKVGSYLPNIWGLYDMHGNVFEWCLDWYGPYAGAVSNPFGPDTGTYRVKRGGTITEGAHNARSAARVYHNAPGSGQTLGFRVVRTVP